MTGTSDDERPMGDRAEKVYVLITQCLQNDFFFNLNCRLHLPEDAAGKLLIHPASPHTFGTKGNRRTLDRATIRGGPLGRFLAATVGERLNGQGDGTLHLVNIRDWHTTSEHYDLERRYYGTHCEAGRWGADYPKDLIDLLDPTGTRRDSRENRPDFNAKGARRGTSSVVVHHVHSNTLFDMGCDLDGERSELAKVLDDIITAENRSDVHIAVVGVYTDIKVQIVLQSIRTAYNPRRLVVSDSLTASPTLERHLAALDFAYKVLWAEVMHGVADLARFLGSDPGDNEELETSANEIAFADYAQYFSDRQSIVSYEDAQLRGYRQQITDRLNKTVSRVNGASMFLIACGVLTLGSSVVLAVIASAFPGRISPVLPALLLGLSVVQLVSVLFNRPLDALTHMLGREAVFRMLLESRSLRLALARYHLTTREALRGGPAASDRAGAIESQLRLLVELDKVDFDRFERFGDAGPSTIVGRAGRPRRTDADRGSGGVDGRSG